MNSFILMFSYFFVPLILSSSSSSSSTAILFLFSFRSSSWFIRIWLIELRGGGSSSIYSNIEIHFTFQRTIYTQKERIFFIDVLFIVCVFTVLYQKRFKKERKARIRIQHQLDAELKRRNQIEDALKASGAPAETLRLLTGSFICVNFMTELARSNGLIEFFIHHHMSTPTYSFIFFVVFFLPFNIVVERRSGKWTTWTTYISGSTHRESIP